MPAKMVIVINKSLNMRKGKMCAQASHAAMKELLFKWKGDRAIIVAAKAVLDAGHTGVVQNLLAPEPLTPAEEEWFFAGTFKKICVSVDSEAALDSLHAAALAKGMTSHMIIDHGLTEFGGVPTKTCIAIGPAMDDEFIGLTDQLPLL